MRPSKRIRRAIACGFRIPLALALLFVVANAAGWLPVNTDYQSDPDGVDIYVYCGAIHSELIIPIQHPYINWRDVFPSEDFADRAPGARFVAVGWGDRDFFRNTRTWEELNLGLAIKALAWPTATAMHVAWRDEASVVSSAQCVRIPQAAYRAIVDSILASLQYDRQGKLTRLQHIGYGDHEAFYASRGRYHLLNTCNNWVNRRLKMSGVRTGRWTPFPHAISGNLPTAQPQQR